MATPAHAFFCFEVLASSFDDSSHPRLQQIVDLYEKSQEGPQDSGRETDGSGHLENDSTNQATMKRGNETLVQAPSISRLQAAEPPARSESSTPLSSSGSSSVSKSTTATTDSYASKLSVMESFPMFVTWNVISRSGHKSLRGCIGTFEGLPLEQGLEQYALTSAFEDTRFSPIPASLICNLSCSLTLLADFDECKDPLDWELGVHGIRISFMHRYRRYGATYLPDVAVEQGWSKEETLDSLMRKAGWESSKRFSRSSPRPWEEVRDFHVIRYTGLKSSASFAQWQAWRKSQNLEKI